MDSLSTSSTYPWTRTDAGRSDSRRPRQSNDCTVRALATACQLSYDAAYDILKDAGRSSGRRFRMQDWLDQQTWAKKISFPAVKGRPRMNVATFSRQYQHGTYIVRVAKHVFAVRDGVVFDDNHNRPDRCVYTAWRIVEVKS